MKLQMSESFHVKRAGDTSLKEWSNVSVGTCNDFMIINDIKKRFQELCRPQYQIVIRSTRGETWAPTLARNASKDEKCITSDIVK